MSEYGPAKDQSRDEAREQSYGCRFCSGEGACEVFDRRYAGSRVVEVDAVVRGEIKRIRASMVVVAHCICPMGQWVRAKTSREMLARIPDLADVLDGNSRWLAEDPSEDALNPPRPMSVGEMKRRVTQRP